MQTSVGQFRQKILQGTLFTGFGWGALAYSQGRDLWFLQWAAVGGAPVIAVFLRMEVSRGYGRGIVKPPWWLFVLAHTTPIMVASSNPPNNNAIQVFFMLFILLSFSNIVSQFSSIETILSFQHLILGALSLGLHKRGDSCLPH